MIIGDALKTVFKDMTVAIQVDSQVMNRAIQYHYGDHKELIKWITHQNKSNKMKYPLIWYVISDYEEVPSNMVEVLSKLIILTDTKVDWLNTTRKVKTYSWIIEPVWNEVKRRLEENQFIDIISKTNKWHIKDEPSYGVDVNNIRLAQDDFSKVAKKGTQSIVTDVVDGRVIKLELRLQIKCLTN